MAKTTKANWKQFFSFEKILLEFLSQQNFLAGDKSDLKYSVHDYKNMQLERPPKFIHCVISLGGEKSLIQKIETDIKELKNRFLTVSDKNLPSRFPQLLQQPLQINLSQHEAFRSRVIDSKTEGFIQIKRYNSDDMSLEDTNFLNAIGIRTEVHNKGFGKTLNILSQDLVAYSTAKKLTVRESSGYQYNARVRYPDNFQAVRMSYGLLIIPDDCHTLSSLPQPRRTHRLETSKQILVLPIAIDSRIFIKEP
ncbi:hypothetical protein [Methylobacter psychrophilus]|uniref:hypothetical protein n=1 Tax=Methylobacter psychrophilus TaxID=96941 RepID=UPI0021D4EF7F|nr:hypothetical protein [Methylobacter psychrophilus]